MLPEAYQKKTVKICWIIRILWYIPSTWVSQKFWELRYYYKTCSKSVFKFKEKTKVSILCRRLREAFKKKRLKLVTSYIFGSKPTLPYVIVTYMANLLFSKCVLYNIFSLFKRQKHYIRLLKSLILSIFYESSLFRFLS